MVCHPYRKWFFLLPKPTGIFHPHIAFGFLYRFPVCPLQSPGKALSAFLYRPDGTKRLADNTLVALTLMIAESRTEEKDIMVKVVVSLINQRNE